jgi:4-hydroxy-4-methyl-2-oxoglutarate aldolase
MSAGPVAEQPGNSVVQSFRDLPTAAVSDALDRLGLVGCCEEILPLDFGLKLVGRAFTVRYRPIGEVDRGTVGDYIDDVEPGSVVVLDNAGRTDCTVWGDILTAVATRRGIGGTVINGVCRDVARAIELRYGLFSRGRFMRTGKDRVEVDRIDVPVSVGTIQVRPGDLLLGDADGVVVVPWSRASEVLDVARQIEEAEKAIEEATSTGIRLSDARRQFRYHELQGDGGRK